MLKLQNLSLTRGVRVLYKAVNLTASDGERVGLVGPNGSGKSTLFAAILSELSPEDGDILAPAPIRISHVAQRILETDSQALQFVLGGHQPLMEAKAALKKAEESSDDIAYATALSQLAEINEGAVVAEAEEILYGLGFKPSDSQRKVSEFSGGWRNRLALARALMKPSDLLLLDEPTNHLDLLSREWIEEAVEGFTGTLLFVSHDRYFVSRFATRVIYLEKGTFTDFQGTYDEFLIWRESNPPVQPEQRPEKTAPRPEKQKTRGGGTKNLTKRVAVLEREIAALEAQLSELDTEMQACASDPEKLCELIARREESDALLTEKMEEWESASAALEQA